MKKILILFLAIPLSSADEIDSRYPRGAGAPRTTVPKEFLPAIYGGDYGDMNGPKPGGLPGSGVGRPRLGLENGSLKNIRIEAELARDGLGSSNPFMGEGFAQVLNEGAGFSKPNGEVIKPVFANTYDLVMWVFIDKTPAHVARAFGKKFDRNEADDFGFAVWQTNWSKKEEVVQWEIWLKDKKWLVANPRWPKLPPRPVISFKAKFSRPAGPMDKNGHGTSKVAFKCWDAYYLLGPRTTE